MTSWLRYARHTDVPVLTAAGWTVCADLGPTHGFYSVLMRWHGEGDPRLPSNDSLIVRREA